MSVLDQLLSKEIAEKAWDQLLKMLIPNDRKQIRQLINRKPIELHESKSSFIVDGAEVEIGIKSYLENLIESGKKKDWFSMVFSPRESFTYNFHVVVNGAMDYPNAQIYMQNNYVNNPFNFNKGRYKLVIKDVGIKEKENLLSVDISLAGGIYIGFLRIKTKGVLNLIGSPYYESSDKSVRIKNLLYTFKTKNFVLKLLDKYYHKRFISFLEDMVVIPIDAALFKARILAQEQMNKHQENKNLAINGVLNDLELERIIVEEKNLKAVFLAQGNLRLA